jgi:soluble lytic murein transglycosylase
MLPTEHPDPRAVSDKGALGLMQLMPETARHFGARNPFDPEQNIAAGTRYVTTLMREFHGDLRLVTAAYNAGDHWVARTQLPATGWCKYLRCLEIIRDPVQ